MKINHLFQEGIVSSLLASIGCANIGKNSQVDARNSQLQTIQKENVILTDKVKKLTQSLYQKDEELSSTKTKLSTTEMELAGSKKSPSGLIDGIIGAKTMAAVHAY